jgi:cytochrome c-type biogenesis protein CcmH
VISRRRWLTSVALGGGAWTVARGAPAQDRAAAGLVDTSNLFPMDQSAARSVRLPPKPGARPSMSAEERDALEHRIRCQCGCTLAVYTCRTTDFSCQVSPAMHRDVMSLVAGGYDADEIIAAFVEVYGERALMAPTREGFNLLAWVLPGSVMAAGALVLALVIRRWKRSDAPRAQAAEPPLDATADELAQIEAAIRDDS